MLCAFGASFEITSISEKEHIVPSAQLEQAAHFFEPMEGGFPEFRHFLTDAGEGLFLLRSGFGEELIRQADEFLLEGFRKEIPCGDWEILRLDFGGGEAAAGMPFADAGKGLQVEADRASILP